MVEREAEGDLAFGEGVLGLSNVLSDLLFGLEDGFGKGLDGCEKLGERRVTWSSCCSVQFSICWRSVAKLININLYHPPTHILKNTAYNTAIAASLIPNSTHSLISI